MKKRLLCAILTMVLIIAAPVTLIACGEEEQTVYDAGEYGTYEYHYGQHIVHENAGYRFIGWSEPVQKGKKTVYNAQYEYAEYYMSEIKDVYEFPQKAYDGFPYIMRKVTNMQTMEETEDIAPLGNIHISCTDERFEWGWGSDWILVNGLTKEFDGICNIAIDDKTYHIEQEIQIHIVRNRIKPESLTIFPFYGEYTVAVGGGCYIGRTYLPEDTTFAACGFNVVEIIRDGKSIDAENIEEIAFFPEGRYEFITTDKAQVGDIIRVQAYNLRDPDVKSDILSITVY